MASPSRRAPARSRKAKASGTTATVATDSPTRPVAGRAVRRRRGQWRQRVIILVVAGVIGSTGALLIYRGIQRASIGEGIPVLPSPHVSAETPANYNSNPPTSGAHTLDEAPWGISQTQLPDIKLIHNLEHGGIVLHYRPDLDAAQQTQLTELARELQRRDRKVVLAPRPENDAPITATAWGRMVRQETLDADAIRAFFSAFINQGPERMP
jgi:hypothetical protein